MTTETRRSTIYFDEGLHRALRMKAAQSHRSISQIVNEAVRAALAEDQEDLAAFEERVAEPTISYETLLDELKADGKL
ncbi:MAG: CopG family transcriptional regulator [Pseudomonadota bacterium]